MVQTEQQYICIHQCLLAVLEGTDGTVVGTTPREAHHNQGFEGKFALSLAVGSSPLLGLFDNDLPISGFLRSGFIWEFC